MSVTLKILALTVLAISAILFLYFFVCSVMTLDRAINQPYFEIVGTGERTDFMGYYILAALNFTASLACFIISLASLWFFRKKLSKPAVKSER